MKIQYASDLHLEMLANAAWIYRNPFIPCSEILILAGDITYLTELHVNSPFFDTLSNQFEAVYIVPGNHEFYSWSYDIERTFPSFRLPIRDNIFYLNNQVIEFPGMRILFTTLFSKISNHSYVKSKINDFSNCIYKGENFTTLDYNDCHANCIDFLEKALAIPFLGNTIIVSHHAPYPPEYCGYPKPTALNEVYHVDLLWLTEKYKIDHWIHGHNHNNQESLKIGKATFHTNQLGYVARDQHKTFRTDVVLEI
ncbi:metallophosphoesterase [uncultured Imperialibacter sp.]|uniref:metallophosphoesterase n=1 Tax=Imperialibacter sp. TaxID=2038411 RepID=UPI0030D70DE3